MTKRDDRPIVILGGGINGAAIARELLLNGLPVCLVDVRDLGSGATAYSSRLVHGGLRYLEYGEVSLVRESLEERARLLRLASDLVQPLRLYIPIQSRLGGAWTSVQRMLRIPARASKHAPRGLWLIGTGLWMYDLFARDRELAGRAVHSTRDTDVPRVDPQYRWFYSYHDAQMCFPERFVIALLEDGRRIARQHGVAFDVYPYHEAKLTEDRIEVRSQVADRRLVAEVQPLAIINATGAWVDRALKALDVTDRQLMGGTKGSHLVTFHAGLRNMLEGRGIYVEANDGRPIFVLPWHQGTLIGTTDEAFHGPPEQARASDPEMGYLLTAVNDLFPEVNLTTDDVALHYAGVRPLPYADSATPGAITRRHWLQSHQGCAVPLYSVIGGKLTTCRSLAEQTAATVLARIGLPIQANSRERVISSSKPGEPFEGPANGDLGWPSKITEEQLASIRRLCGVNTNDRLVADNRDETDDWQSVVDTHLPRRFVRNVIRQEWVTCLSDLVERRLMLLYDQRLSVRCLRELAGLLAREGLLAETDTDAEVETYRRRLESQFGRCLPND